MERFGAVIVAAGKGTRMGTTQSKQYLPLGQQPILIHTLQVFSSMKELASLVVVTGADDIGMVRQMLDAYDLNEVVVIAGGKERQHSVFRGLQALPEGTQWALVHDGVRPFVRRADIRRCLFAAVEHDAAVLAVPVKETIKIAAADGTVLSTPDRSSLWSIQTPQAFRLSVLLDAYREAEKDGFVGTDDASLVERIGQAVHLVEGQYTNIKITTPDDMIWASRLLEEEESDD